MTTDAAQGVIPEITVGHRIRIAALAVWSAYKEPNLANGKFRVTMQACAVPHAYTIPGTSRVISLEQYDRRSEYHIWSATLDGSNLPLALTQDYVFLK